MPADFKGRIRFNPDVKPSDCPWKISCPSLGIVEEGSGDISEMMDDLTEEIRNKLSEEFRTTPRSVQIVGYSMSLDFEVIGPVNRSLAEFEGTYSAMVRLGDGTEIPMEKLTKTASQVLECAKRSGKTVEEVIAEAKAEIASRKKKSEGAKS